MFAGKKSAQIREILISESAWEEMTCLFAPSLRVENARPFLNGEAVQVIEGAGNGRSIHLEVFLRREDDAWKIYRVRDVTNNHEHPIFDAGAITRAKAAAESTP
ncbi:DUF3828 domain-containing protein [Enterobacter roggenkampii]|nr:DUF3828 domain-containing protein [Enterobacter roggenkampii]